MNTFSDFLRAPCGQTTTTFDLHFINTRVSAISIRAKPEVFLTNGMHPTPLGYGIHSYGSSSVDHKELYSTVLFKFVFLICLSGILLCALKN